MTDHHGKFVWYELMTSDTAAAEAFYRAVIGWGAHDAGMPGMSYTLFTADNFVISVSIPKGKSAIYGRSTTATSHSGVERNHAHPVHMTPSRHMAIASSRQREVRVPTRMSPPIPID